MRSGACQNTLKGHGQESPPGLAALGHLHEDEGSLPGAQDEVRAIFRVQQGIALPGLLGLRQEAGGLLPQPAEDPVELQPKLIVAAAYPALFVYGLPP